MSRTLDAVPDDIVTEAARIVNPGAFSSPWTNELGEASDVEISRRNYQRAAARHAASQILKLAARTPALARLLAEVEKDDWSRLGVPIRGNLEAEHMVEQKYQVSQ